MKPNYKVFKNELFITNNKTVVEVFTSNEKEGREEKQLPYQRLSNFLNIK